MARADLLVDLAKYALSGNRNMVKKVTESIIAEERAKQHGVLADRLQQELESAPVDSPRQNNTFGHVSFAPHDIVRAETLFQEILPKKRFTDLILPQSIIKNCQEVVDEHFRADLLRSYGLEPRNRILLIGAPGNGKTSLAEAIAEAMMVPLYVVKYDSVIGAYLGETAMRLRKMMDFVSTRKCVLFFDEFETIGKERGDTHETGEIKRVVSSLLLQMDELPSYVTVIGATNHPELLDKASWRRFQLRMLLQPPTRANISMWLERFQQKHNISFGYASETIAKKLLGGSFAEVEEFGLLVLRKYVLSLPNDNIKAIIADTLKDWEDITNKIDGRTNIED